MGRAARLTYRGALHHATLRCNNKEFLFEPVSQALFLTVLKESCEKQGVRLFNYCLMTNHVHLLFDVPTDGTLSEFMHRVANVFAKRFNTGRERKGHLWEARFRSTVVEAGSCFFRVMAYIDLNPVRARMVSRAGEYLWSGHRDVVTESESVIRLHPLYLDLGADCSMRRAAYERILQEESLRVPYSLASVLFVGSPTFLRKMRSRFGMVGEKARWIEARELDAGLYVAEPRQLRLARGSSAGRSATQAME